MLEIPCLLWVTWYIALNHRHSDNFGRDRLIVPAMGDAR